MFANSGFPYHFVTIIMQDPRAVKQPSLTLEMM